MTDQEKEIFDRLLVDLFIDNPKRKQPQVQEGLRTDEKVSSRETKRSRTRPYQATQDK